MLYQDNEQKLCLKSRLLFEFLGWFNHGPTHFTRLSIIGLFKTNYLNMLMRLDPVYCLACSIIIFLVSHLVYKK